MKRAEVWGIVACAAAGAVSIALSWNRWLDPVIDAGRDLYVPQRLAEGAHLYSDVAYNYPPLAPYALAAAVRVFGSSLGLYIAIGMLLAIASAAGMYLLARKLAGPSGAFVATLMFVTLCVAGRPNFNFFFPYAHAMTFGAAATILFLATSSVTFGVLACLAKVEFAAVVIACAVVMRRWLAALLFVIVAIAFAAIPAKVVSGASGFYRQLAIGDWRLMVTGIVILASVAVLSRAPIAIWIAPLFLLVSADDVFAATPAVHLALLPFLRRKPALPLLWCASVFSTTRIALNVSPTFNGFAYVLPTIVLLVYAAFAFFPKPLWIALFVGISLHALWRPAPPAVRVQTPHGSYLDSDLSRGRVIQQVIDSLPHHGTLVVIPEGVTINYFADMRTPLHAYLFTPPEFDESITREFAARPPDFVLVVPRSVTEYGSRGFGVDYGQSLATLIHERYAIERTFRDRYYVAELWRRR